MEQTFIYDNVKIFGTKPRMVTAQDLAVIKIPPESMTHLLRHFSVIDEENRQWLFKKKNFWQKRFDPTLTPEQLEALLNTAGSKFNPSLSNFREVLMHLLNFLQAAINNNEIAAPWIEYNTELGKWYTEISFTLSNAQRTMLGISNDGYAGTRGAVLIDEQNKALIQQEQRGKGDATDTLVVNIIKEQTPPGSNTITANLCHDPELFTTTLLSIYTSDGHFSPPFPDKSKQSAEEFEYNKAWWEKHAFYR